jgi:hypothetical protein
VIVGTAVASIAMFMIALWWLGIASVATDALTTTQGAVATMRDGALNDRAREKAIQAASLRLIADFVSLLIRTFLAIALSAVPIWLAIVSGLATAEKVFRFLVGWEAAVIATALAAVAYGIRTQPWRTS